MKTLPISFLLAGTVLAFLSFPPDARARQMAKIAVEYEFRESGSLGGPLTTKDVRKLTGFFTSDRSIYRLWSGNVATPTRGYEESGLYSGEYYYYLLRIALDQVKESNSVNEGVMYLYSAPMPVSIYGPTAILMGSHVLWAQTNKSEKIEQVDPFGPACPMFRDNQKKLHAQWLGRVGDALKYVEYKDGKVHFFSGGMVVEEALGPKSKVNQTNTIVLFLQTTNLPGFGSIPVDVRVRRFFVEPGTLKESETEVILRSTILAVSEPEEIGDQSIQFDYPVKVFDRRFTNSAGNLVNYAYLTTNRLRTVMEIKQDRLFFDQTIAADALSVKRRVSSFVYTFFYLTVLSPVLFIAVKHLKSKKHYED